MGLFSKKNCSICGGKIGMLGNRKLEDGNLCKECAAKLSPWFSDRRHSTVGDIEKQLSDREANRQRVAAFTTTRKMGLGYDCLFIDENKGNFAVCTERDWNAKNPDIIPLSAIKSCITNRQEHRTEKKYKDSNGNMVSYTPPQYEYSYDYFCEIGVNHPYIDEIRFRINDMTLKEGGLMGLNFQNKMNDVQRTCSEIEIFMNSTRFMKPAQAEMTRVLLPATDLPYKAAPEDGEYGVNIRMKGSVYYGVVDQEAYARIPGTVDIFIRMEAMNKITETVLFFKNQGASGREIVSAQEMFKAKFLELLGESILGLFGIGDLKADVELTLDASCEPLKELLAQQKLLESQQAQAMMGQPMSDKAMLADWQCPNCGAVNSSKFCSNCGTKRP